MAQILYVDMKDGFGERDFTGYVTEPGTFTRERNRPASLTFTVVPVGDLSAWIIPTSGATVRLVDTVRWQSRLVGAREGTIFTGYINNNPDPILLGMDVHGENVFSFTCTCTSEEYLISALKTVPAKTYVNKSHGEIIIDLLKTMFDDVVPYNVDNVHNGNVERIFQCDSSRKLTDIIADFAKSDGFTSYIHDGVLVYEPQGEYLPNSNDPALKLMIDAQDPRFTAEGLALKPLSVSIVNDVTVFGADEATTFVREHFVSSGYEPNFQLAFVPFGATERVLLNDDFTGDAIDTALWTEKDTGSNYIQGFQGSLNIVGGPNIGTGTTSGSVFLRSRKGIELSGLITCRDGELNLSAFSAGTGIIGGMYTSAGDTMDEADLFCGWKVYLGGVGQAIYPFGPDGIEVGSGFLLNTTHSYVLRRTFEVDQSSRTLNTYNSAANSFVQTFGPVAPPVANCTITWQIDDINTDDPAHVTTTTTTLLRHQYNDVTDFVLYCPVVTYNMHCTLNFVSISAPQQVVVLVDDAPVTVGSALDGGRCTITTDGGVARLAWYATPKPSQGARSATDLLLDQVTIPPQGAFVEVRYWRSAPSSARVQNMQSILSEQVMFRDDGIRQQILMPGDITPSPNTSIECEALAQAYLADRANILYDGSYKFQSGEHDPTVLTDWPFPGDEIPINFPLPDGSVLDLRLPISKVEASILGVDTYAFTLSFGAFDRVAEVVRKLVRSRQSSMNMPSIVDVPITDMVTLATVTTPVNPSVVITGTTATTFSVVVSSGASSVLSGVTGNVVVGWEVRDDDTGWGQPNYVLRFAGPNYTFTRTQRDQSYYIRPYNAAGVYSRLSAFVRIQHPLTNTMVITAVDGLLSPTTIEIDVTLPNNPDIAGIVLRKDNAAGIILYEGDGILTKTQAAGANVIVGTSLIQVLLDNPTALRTYTIWVAPYDLIGSVGTPATFTLTKNAPTVTAPAPSPTDDDVWAWTNTGTDSTDVTVWDSGGTPTSWTVPGDTTSLNLGHGGGYKYVEVRANDDWGSTTGSATQLGDRAIPPQPGITVSVGTSATTAPAGQMYYDIRWDFLYAGVGFVNMATADALELNYSTSSTFASGVVSVGLVPSANGYAQIIVPLATLYFRIRAHNSYGWSVWSGTTAGISTGGPLDALAVGTSFDYSNPSFDPTIRLGSSTGHTLANADDGTGRSLAGLSTVGDLVRNLLYGVKGYNSGGALNFLMNAGNSITEMGDGPYAYNGAGRANSGLDGSGNVSRNLVYGILNYASNGSPYEPYHLGFSTLDNVNNGGTYSKTTGTQVGYADRAGAGLSSGGYIIIGLISGGNVLNVAYMFDFLDRSDNAIEAGGARIQNDKVDGYSVKASILNGANISGGWRSAGFGTTTGGSGYDRTY